MYLHALDAASPCNDVERSFVSLWQPPCQDALGETRKNHGTDFC